MKPAKRLFVQAPPWRRALRRVLEVLLCRLPVGKVLGRLPLLPRLYARLVLARTDHTGLHTGIYATYTQALADIPESRLAGWNHDESATLWVDRIDPVILSTYPVLFWLSRLYGDNSALVDVGGSIGLTYYAYRKYAPIPAGSTWTVVEMPKMCEQGSRIAERERAAGLRFTTDPARAGRADLLLSAGALQFMERSLPGLLENLPARPRHILLNKLPITSQPDCWTLHNYGPAVTPQRLFNDRSFLAYFEGHGYRLRDRWEVEDLDCLVPFHPDRFIRRFSGFLFESAD